ncbi:MAG: IPTL-CTERM sorting domain-containing protein, partial [Deltaproteobacteria bacterium]|nr:IPTL-CTERM sorting domain-containing protein [Deltaproteobacteria bacterium]
QNPTVGPATLAMEGTYTLTVAYMDGSTTGCVAEDTVYVDVLDAPNPNASADPNPVCEDENFVLMGSATGGEGGTYAYSWKGPDSYTSNSQNPTVGPATQSMEGTYTLTVTEMEGSTTGCSATDDVYVTVNENPDCQIMVDDSASDGYVEPGSTHTAWIATPSGGVGDATPSGGVGDITWTVVDSEGHDLVVPPGSNKDLTVTFKAPLEPTFIKIAVALVDGNGCTCEFDPPLIVEGPDAANGILKVWRYIPTLGGWGLIGLAALMAGAGAWVVRRRKRS